MELFVKFIAAENAKEISDNIEYINNIFKELNESGLIKSIMTSPKDVGASVKVVKEIDEEGNLFCVEFCGEEKGKSENWKVTFQYGTYNESKQLEIRIESDTFQIDKEKSCLEKLKLAIKKAIVKDWKRIIWLTDKDSECLSIELYSRIYKTENLMRQLINEVMIKEYGTTWWDSFAPDKIKAKHGQRKKAYKSNVPSFANVDERLMSIDINDLAELITLKRYKWNPVYDEKISSLLNGVQKYNDTILHELLNKQRTVDIDLWKNHFSKYLTDDFCEKYKKFANDRNHIMHNKLIDRKAYYMIKELADEIEDKLSKAILKLSQTILSKEEREEIQKQKEIELEMLEILEHECKEKDANVSIRSHEDISDLFEDSIMKFIDEIEDKLRFRSDIEITNKFVMSGSEMGELLLIESKLDMTKLLFEYSMSIVDDEGGESELEIYCSSGGSSFKECIVYTNGAAEYNSDSGLYEPITEDDLEDINSIIEDTEEFINNEIEDYKETADEENCIDYIFCSECGEDVISINHYSLEDGTCLNCGYVNEVYQCEKCENWFNSKEEGLVYEEEICICQDCLDNMKTSSK